MPFINTTFQNNYTIADVTTSAKLTLFGHSNKKGGREEVEGVVKNRIIFEDGLKDVFIMEWEEEVQFVCGERGEGEEYGCVVEYVSEGVEVKSPKYFLFLFLFFYFYFLFF